MAIILAVTGILGVLAGLPSIWPDALPALHGVQVDTDPENMLSADEPVRVFHNEMRRALGLYDMVVLGVVNDEHPNGVFNPESLGKVTTLTDYATTLRGSVLGEDDPNAGIVDRDIIAPSLVDNIEQGGAGEVRFEWLMATSPDTESAALAVRTKAQRIPLLNGTLVSEDGKAVCLYLPLTSKDLSHRVYTRLQAKIAELEQADGGDRFFITGLPVAEDVFGHEMFVQMAVSAPAAMVVIFLLMLFFFRKLSLIVSPLIVAIVSVICTMALLVATGNTIHIMSSMIPIFIMPIAVLDSIHILSEFFDRYQETRDRRKTMLEVMGTLFTPMLYTSLTSTAGFASLALTPIPPVQVFGVFVAFGIMLAWFLTVLFIPAYVMLLSEKRLENFGAAHVAGERSGSFSSRLLAGVGGFTFQRAKLVITGAVVVAVFAGSGIARIRVNDNPIKWFRSSHDIRVADRVLNEHFGGTYMAYLALSPKGEPVPAQLEAPSPEPAPEAPALPSGLGGGPALPAGLGGETVPEAPAAVDTLDTGPELFKNPEVLRYIGGLQQHLDATAAVGKSNSLGDIVKTVYRELTDGEDASFRVPDTPNAVAQCLMQYQSSHRPGDLWHFVTPDYRHTSIWVQLTSGDNLDMQQVVEAVDAYVAERPLRFEVDGVPVELEYRWFGKTFINVVWQDKMVAGMRDAFLGSFLVVLLMMILLFRSGLWGLLSMIPLTLTIGLIYGVIGFIGKDYDMPVAVLSSLTLGLAVDFAIHFLARARELHGQHGSWAAAHVPAFGEPARAITRNVIVIAVGFLPLLLATLVPYNTVGIFLASILLISGAGTLLLLPALIRVLEPLLFPKTKLCSVTCRCGTCVVTGVTALALVLLNVRLFVDKGLSWFAVVSLIALPILAIGCFLMSRRAKCQSEEIQ